jgi:hypothetical protein
VGVKRISVGGIQAPEFFKLRDWSIPFLPLFTHEPIGATRGRRSATCTGVAQYKAFGRTLALTLSNTGANQVFELGEASLITVPPDGGAGGPLLSSYFYFAMTMNQTSGALGNAAGECLQGFGIGSMGRDTPWIGQFTGGGTGTVIHVRWNVTRQKWELFAANDNYDLGNTVDLQIQPNFGIDLRLPEIAMEWIPPNTINIYCNQQLVHTQDMNKMLPNGGVFGDTGQVELIMFVANGSNAAFNHLEAGFYMPRFYQPITYQPVL